MGEDTQQVRYVERVSEFQHRSSWFAEAEKLIDRSDLLFGAEVLDFGCGPGRFTDMLFEHGFQTTGYDPDQAMIDVAALRYPNPRFIGGGSFYRFATGSTYDAIFCLHVLGHVHDLNTTLLDLKGCLKPGGRLIVLNPNLRHTRLIRPWNALRGFKADPTIKHRFTDYQLAQRAKYLGLVPEWRYMSGTTFLGERSLFALCLRKPYRN